MRRVTSAKVVVAGVSGSGKSTIGSLVAASIGAAFIDGDDLHPPANVAKMAAGHPLTDADRAPWLDAIVEQLANTESIVVACSALRRSYRDTLRQIGGVKIVLLDISVDEAASRLDQRMDHFMGSSMVRSQFDSLELPTADEPAVVVISASDPIDVVVDRVLAAF